MKGIQTGFANNWSSTITAPIGAADTVLNVSQADAGALANQVTEILGSTAFQRPIPLTLGEPGGPYEAVLATGINTFSGDITIIRGDQDTTAQAWPAGATIGAYVTRDGLAGLAEGFRPVFYLEVDMSGGNATAQLLGHLTGQKILVPSYLGDPPPGSILTIQPPAAPGAVGLSEWSWRGMVEVNNGTNESIDLDFSAFTVGAGVPPSLLPSDYTLLELIYWTTTSWAVRAL